MNIQPSNQYQPVPSIGQRYRLRRSVDRDPYFLAPLGLTGTIIQADTHIIRLQMDEKLTGEFDNCIEWYDYEPTFPLLNTFYEDCELLSDDCVASAETYYHTLGTDGREEAQSIVIGLTDLGYQDSEVIQTARLEWVAQVVTDHPVEGEEYEKLSQLAKEQDAELLVNFTEPTQPW